MENLDSLLRKQAAELKELATIQRNENPALQMSEEAFLEAIDIKKEYSALYRTRLNALKPLIQTAATKKWGTTGVNYNSTLLSVRPGVLLLSCRKIS